MAAHPLKKAGARYTWSDYRTWPDEERWEIIDGTPYAMAPAPTTNHQQIVLTLGGFLLRALQGRGCTPFIAPTDVRLSEFDVVQPDILIVRDPAKILPTHIEGAPDVTIEVLSPATATKDLREKKALYEKSGVREYVVVDPIEHYAIRFLLGSDATYDKGTVVGADETLALVSVEGVEVAMWEVFGVAGPGEADAAAA